MHVTRRIRTSVWGWSFALPALVLFTIFVIAPFAYAIVLSFTDRRLTSPRPAEFVGFENYAEILSDDRFQRAIRNNVVFALMAVPIQNALALGLAVLLNQKLRFTALFRTAFFVPITFPLAAAAVVWIVLLNPSGLINAVMETITFGRFAPDWLNDTRWAMVAVLLVSVWNSVGFQMVILLAALQDVPRTLYEAAAVDGANGWQKFRHVTLPGVKRPLQFVITVSTILSFRLFDQVWIMPARPGGPIDSTTTIMVELVQIGLQRQLLGRGSAIAVILFVIVLSITLVMQSIQRRTAS